MFRAVAVALAGILLLFAAGVAVPASAQTHSHGHGHDDHQGIPYMMMASGTATHIKDRTASDSSVDIHMLTTKANDNAVSFKVVEGELKVGDKTYSIVGGKANLAVKSGRLGITMTLKDDAGKSQLLRITSVLADPLPHDGDDPASVNFKVAKALRFWKLDMRGEVAMSEPESSG
ncbi:MAG: hypothetical protein QXJ74_01330 [Nitrososphaera sp.]|uniref:hypothetical protein n=1 Tax=Nitrososphaera sp. TaxID=1971748 RepID=UPI001832630B|nr:hypothetical protein [Nitrososphaera sp.]NWG37658.1 hypothetical protein [Nitrososphaera sp.]